MRLARLARRTVLVLGAAFAVLGLGATAALADDWGQRVPGQHVYDPAGALTPAQVSDLERSAAAVDQAGAPTVVYVRRKDADDATTRQDARALMDAWAVESSAGQKDGFVLLLNLKPADVAHGSTALVAGASLADRLGADRLQAVYDGTMKPRLAAGDLAGAVSAALARVAADLAHPVASTSSEPPQSPAEMAVFLLAFGAMIAALVGFGLLVPRLRNRGGSPPRGGSDNSSMFTSADSSSYTGGGGDGGASSGSSSGGGSF
jgi:uncharacterized membrane protein YgcG